MCVTSRNAIRAEVEELYAAGAAHLAFRERFRLRTLQPTVDAGIPLEHYPARDWEKVYRDQYKYDSSFTFVCSPNDTHACRLRAFVRNGIVMRAEQNYDVQRYSDLYGNTASPAWNPRGCPKGFTVTRRLYGPYRHRRQAEVRAALLHRCHAHADPDQVSVVLQCQPVQQCPGAFSILWSPPGVGWANCQRMLNESSDATARLGLRLRLSASYPLPVSLGEPQIKLCTHNAKHAYDMLGFRLRELLAMNLKTVRAYLLKESFQQLWEYRSAYWAGQFLDRWGTAVMHSQIDPLKKFAKSVRGHQELILNWFRARKEFSCGIVEDFNCKLKLTIRKAYGFRTFQATEIALDHALGDLPVPQFTHTFC